MKQPATSMGRDAQRLCSRWKHRLTPRNWLIVFAVAYLHLRHLWFHPRLLERLQVQAIAPMLHLTDVEFSLASAWNRRFGDLLTSTGAPYARCMKRCFVAASLLGGRNGLFVIIGVLPDKRTEGHAWIELGGEIIAERFDPRLTPYVEIRRIAVRPCENNCDSVINH